jgi:hypothetical protein
MPRMCVRKVLRVSVLISEALTPLAEAITALSLVAQGVMKSNMAWMKKIDVYMDGARVTRL